ncbi:MAG: hypothetical protein ABEJ93_04805, partial [Candidatus Nanohalobium sp.]
MKKYLAFVASFFLVSGLASAASISLHSSQQVYADGDNISFKVSAKPGDYTLYFTDAPFEKDFSISGNDTSAEYTKIVNHTFSGIAFDSLVKASLENRSVSTQEFYVGTGKPVFQSISMDPKFVTKEDAVNVDVRVADADMDVQKAVLTVHAPNRTFSREMSLESQEEAFYNFESGFIANETGEWFYSID